MKISEVECPICKWKGKKFKDLDCDYGHIYKNAECPKCKSQPRHRLLYLYLKKIIPKNKSLRLLHFAPDSLKNLFVQYKNLKYLSVDINPKRAMKKEDITKLSFKNESFDIIICIHVLEHVQKDKKAMKELHRVLKKNGFAIIDVPLDYSRKKTDEDFSVTDPIERTKRFLQQDHVRLYGRNFKNRLKEAGFKVKTDNFASSLSKSYRKKYGLENKLIYFCKK